MFGNLPDSASEYSRGDISLLVGAGICRAVMRDSQEKIYELLPLYAIFVSHGWMGDSWFPEFWSDIFPVDTAAYGDVVMGSSNMFCYGCIDRRNCGFEPHAQVLRTLGDAYANAGYEINADPIGVRHQREMVNTTGAVISVVIRENEGLYSGQSRIPFPNAPVLRGIGLK